MLSGTQRRQPGIGFGHLRPKQHRVRAVGQQATEIRVAAFADAAEAGLYRSRMAPSLVIFDDTILALRCRPGPIHPISLLGRMAAERD
jgi:hypothetical protein